MNTCQFLGTVYKTAELKRTNEGTAVYLFTLKVQRGSGKGEVFVPVRAWGNIAENTIEHIKEGNKLHVTAYYHAYTIEKDGEKKYRHNFNAQSIVNLSENIRELNIDELDDLFK
jgi:single-stranded DNA-binding protein